MIEVWCIFLCYYRKNPFRIGVLLFVRISSKFLHHDNNNILSIVHDFNKILIFFYVYNFLIYSRMYLLMFRILGLLFYLIHQIVQTPTPLRYYVSLRL
jgi:hypothetical protein